MGNTKATHIIAVDAMGADQGPEEVVAAVALAMKEGKRPGHILIVGDESTMRPILDKEGLSRRDDIEIFHASEVIGMDEKPIQSLKRKKDSSLVRAIELVKDGKAAAAVSCGNTGSLMACGTLRLRPMEGVERPALGSVWPGRDQHFIMLDVGANPSPRPEHYVHNAILGSHYCKTVLGRSNPRVGLLSVGTEEGKGNELIQEANAKLKEIGDIINYHGPIEGFQVFNDVVDVVVTDGFTGNVLLKSCESLFRTLKHTVTAEIKRNPLRMAGALLCKGAFQSVKKKIQPEQYGGAPLLGLRGNVLKAHGSSNRYAIAAAIRIACECIENEMRAHAREDIARANALIKPVKEQAKAEAEG